MERSDEIREPEPGQLPEAKPRGRAWLWNRLKQNWLMPTVIGGVFILICACAVTLAIRALNQPITPATATSDVLKITPPSNAATGTPLTNTYPADNTTGSSANPPGVDPNEWARYQAWKAACPNGQCQYTQQQQGSTETPAQKRRDKLADLEWSARLAKPDTGNHQAQQQQQPPQPQLPSKPAAPTQQPESPNATPEPRANNEPQFASWNGSSSGPAYTLVAGITPIKARLITAITGDANGPVIAETVQPVYSWDDTMLLVPKGSFLIGHYGRVAEQDQERLLLAIDTLIMPDAFRLTFPQVDILDQTGEVGVKDKVNHHYAQIFLTSIAIAGIGAGAQFGGGSSGYGFSPVDVVRIGFGQGSSQAAQQVFARFANRKPTLTIRAGIEIVLFPPIDVPLPAWKDHHVQQPI